MNTAPAPYEATYRHRHAGDVHTHYCTHGGRFAGMEQNPGPYTHVVTRGRRVLEFGTLAQCEAVADDIRRWDDTARPRVTAINGGR